MRSGLGSKHVTEDFDRFDELIVDHIRGGSKSDESAARITADAPLAERGTQLLRPWCADRQEAAAAFVRHRHDLCD